MTDQNAIPSGWARATIEEIFAPLRDGRTLHQGWSPQCDDEPAGDGEWGVLRTTAIQPGHFLPEHNKRLPGGLKPRAAIAVESGDILLTCAGPRARCGVPCLVRMTRAKLMMSGKMYRFRVSPTLMSAAFVEAFLLSSDAQAAIDRMKTGGSDSGLNLTHERFRRLPLLVAPAGEQLRIVEAIDSYLTRLEDAVTGLTRVQTRLRAYRASVLKAAVEGRLVATEASLARAKKSDFESADMLLGRILKERRRRWEDSELAKLQAAGKAPKGDEWKAKYDEPPVPDTSTLPALPDGWCWASLSALIVEGPQNGIYVPKSRYGDGTPILRIDDYQVDWSKSASELQRVQLPKNDQARFGLSVGDLVLNRVNSPSHLGKTLAVEARHLPAVFESNMMRFRLSSALSPRFLHFYLSSAQGKQRLTSGAKWAVNQASINQQDVGNTAVPLPPQSEQIRVVAEIERLLSAARATSASVEHDAKRTVRLRQAVLKWAFDGKLVDQDSKDEPADKLLARIRAERAPAASIKKSGNRKAKRAR